MKSKTARATAVALSCLAGALVASAGELVYEWQTVANNGDLIPATSKYFNAYNQPAVNQDGRVVFRARSKGGGGAGPTAPQPVHGIFTRDLGEGGAIQTVFKRDGHVPEPTRAGPGGNVPVFNEFPSIPRIDSSSDTIATRAQSRPVWLDPVLGETGTAGVYADPGGVPTTAASMVGDVFEGGVQLFPHFQVPVHGDVPAGTGFDQFPGSPAVTGGTTIVFKGNFAVDGARRTGVFHRDLTASGGMAPVELIAVSLHTEIPGCKPKGAPTCLFRSTAPPSADGKYVVFAGYDDEAAPTAGGIYRARLDGRSIRLETVVRIGERVPGERKGISFKAFGEAVSVASNGRLVLFWGTWGEQTRTVELSCPSDGNAARRAYCEERLAADPDFNTRSVPVKQGFFLRDVQVGTTTVIAKTGDLAGGESVTDFVYWNFAGRVPGMEGEGDDIEESARWRTATFGAVSGTGVPAVSAFKARTADGADGIYLRDTLPSGAGDVVKILKTGDPAETVELDPRAAGMAVASLGMERDGFRGDWLAITAGMAPLEALALQVGGGGSDEVTGWSGVYVAHFLGDDK